MKRRLLWVIVLSVGILQLAIAANNWGFEAIQLYAPSRYALRARVGWMVIAAPILEESLSFILYRFIAVNVGLGWTIVVPLVCGLWEDTHEVFSWHGPGYESVLWMLFGFGLWCDHLRWWGIGYLGRFAKWTLPVMILFHVAHNLAGSYNLWKTLIELPWHQYIRTGALIVGTVIPAVFLLAAFWRLCSKGITGVAKRG